ncbi:MAG TPA: histidine kinase [Anaerolineaceae bacterium]|nr:histidine kinase [Anaerolineaceae bacterium]
MNNAAHALLLLSPPAVSLVPTLLLHLAIFIYLCRVRQQSAATRWLNGWLTAILLGDIFLFLGASLYAPAGGYMELGTIALAFLSIVPSLQFAYLFPQPAFPRETRRVLVFSTLLVAGCLLGLVVEHLAWPIDYLYDFERFTFFNPIRADSGLLPVSVRVFDIVYSLSLVWFWVIWLRKTVYFSLRQAHPGPRSREDCRGWRAVLTALLRPQGRDARVTRTFTLAMLLAPATYLLTLLELWTPYLASSSVVLYLLTLSGLMVVFINNSAAPTSFMVKLVGISLVTILVIFGLALPYILTTYDEAYDQVRQAELPHVIQAVETGRPAALPEELFYLASRPAPTTAAPYPTTFRLLYARSAGFEPQALTQEDERLLEALLAAGPAAGSSLEEGPWLKPEQAMLRHAGGLAQLLMPEGERSYRGMYTDPTGHAVRYTIRSADGQTLYEAGYDYRAYRQELHRKALPLFCLVTGAALLIGLLFPHFFRRSLVRPLHSLLAGVGRVNRGELDVAVPIAATDEIGELTANFNAMVHSLQALTAGLQAEIGERKRAEAEVRSLNESLEGRIAYRTRELTTLYEIAAAASQSLSQEALLRDCLTRVMAAVPADAGAIYLLGAPEAPIRQVTEANAAAGATLLDRLLADPALTDGIVHQAEPWLVPNVTNEPGLAHLSPSLHSLLLTPLLARGEAVGFLGLTRQLGDAFMLDEIALLTTIAQQIAIAVQGNQLRQLATLHKERERIARDLHDSVTQSLYGLVLLVENGQAQLAASRSAAAAHTLQRMEETTRQALKEMRLLIHQLRPPILAEIGLVGALHQRLSAVEGRNNIQTRLLADEGLAFAEPVESAFYGIAQEALNNSLKHARASTVRVVLRQETGQQILEIMDNGCGFCPESAASRGLGLTGMRERAAQVDGQLEVISAPGEGTTIRVRIRGKE